MCVVYIFVKVGLWLVWLYDVAAYYITILINYIFILCVSVCKYTKFNVFGFEVICDLIAMTKIGVFF